jgi:uncharacterized protein (DUF2141 family)
MKLKFILLVPIFLFAVKAMAQQTLTVQITNIKNDEGQIAVALYNSEKDFMQTRYQGKITKASKGEVEVVFEDLPAGTYALSVMHDANQNGKLDYRSVGIPKEGFGFSNNPVGKLGLPPYEKAKIEIPPVQKIQITLKYIELGRKKEKDQ